MKILEQEMIQEFQQGNYRYFYNIYPHYLDQLYSILIDKLKGDKEKTEQQCEEIIIALFKQLQNPEYKELSATQLLAELLYQKLNFNDKEKTELLNSNEEKTINWYKKILSSKPKETANKPLQKKLKKIVKKLIFKEKQHNPRYITYYLHYFRYYFTGFSISIWIGILLFLLGFLRFNPHPFYIEKGSVINYIGANAFWSAEEIKEQYFREDDNEDLDEWISPITFPSYLYERPADEETQIEENEEIQINEEDTDLQETEREETQLNEKAQETKYYINPEKITPLRKNILIFKEETSKTPWVERISSIFNKELPQLNYKKFKGSSLLAFELNDSLGNYHYQIKLQDKVLDIKTNYREQPKKDLSEKKIKKDITKTLEELGVDMKYYQNPQLIPSENNEEEKTFFMPYMIEKIPVWDADSKKAIGISISYDNINKKILNFKDISLRSYQGSEYLIDKKKESILQGLAEKIPLTYEKKAGERLTQGELIYLQREDILTPALLFKAKDQKEVIIDLI